MTGNSLEAEHHGKASGLLVKEMWVLGDYGGDMRVGMKMFCRVHGVF